MANKYRFSRSAVVCFFCMMFFSDVWAWGLTGHRIVGALAEKHLTPKARESVSQILQGYRLQDVSNWADEIKSDNSAFSKSLRKWHYVELHAEEDLDVVLGEDWPEDLNIALMHIIQRLEKRDFDQQLTEPVLIRLLTHLVADAHQPLHVGNGKDSGGNTCHVRWFYSKWTTSLHSVWDTRLIDSYKLTYSEYADYLDHVDAKTEARWQNDTSKSWLLESYRLHPEIYPAENGVQTQDYCVKSRSQLRDKKVPKLGYAYQSRVRPILNQRLTQAGIRLAGVLNHIYDPQQSSQNTHDVGQHRSEMNNGE
jgi:hypothetical protein